MTGYTLAVTFYCWLRFPASLPSMTDADATAVLAVKQVFEQRSMYDAVVAGNYMHHAELIAALAAWAK